MLENNSLVSAAPVLESRRHIQVNPTPPINSEFPKLPLSNKVILTGGLHAYELTFSADISSIIAVALGLQR
jgi:hypothetical protein